MLGAVTPSGQYCLLSDGQRREMARLIVEGVLTSPRLEENLENHPHWPESKPPVARP